MIISLQQQITDLVYLPSGSRQLTLGLFIGAFSLDSFCLNFFVFFSWKPLTATAADKTDESVLIRP